jgi:hypothetical protein
MQHRGILNGGYPSSTWLHTGFGEGRGVGVGDEGGTWQHPNSNTLQTGRTMRHMKAEEVPMKGRRWMRRILNGCSCVKLELTLG